MPIRIFNTLTQKKEEYVPRNTEAGKEHPEVSLYTCGPTVYDYAHIGNLRTFIFEDVLRRLLEANGYRVKQVMNITDVGHLTDDADSGEDKMEKGARREKKNAWDIAEYYTDAFLKDSGDLNILSPTLMPRATQYIEQQIALVQRLEEAGVTYRTSDGIYFDTSLFPNYGKLARLDIAGLEEGARVAKHPEKKNASDFAVWKCSPAGSTRDMEWNYPGLGMGFPGWHLECSAMAMALLGETIDIHCGGVDHIPVHHTNEIAQSESVTGKPYVRYWMHGEFLLVNEGRMGKSVGNFIRLEDVRAHKIEPLAYRYFVLGAHYRSKLNFSWETLAGAQRSYTKLVGMVAQWNNQTTERETIDEYMARFMKAVNDDMNTAQGLAIMWEMLKSDHSTSKKSRTLFEMDKVLGLNIHAQAMEYAEKTVVASTDYEELLRKREQARAQHDFEEADRIRDMLEEKGFMIEDTPEGPHLRPMETDIDSEAAK